MGPHHVAIRLPASLRSHLKGGWEVRRASDHHLRPLPRSLMTQQPASLVKQLGVGTQDGIILFKLILG